MKRGVIDREPCRMCGCTTVEAHHPDYDRPWFVTWLCRDHHRAVHRPEEPGQMLIWLGA